MQNESIIYKYATLSSMRELLQNIKVKEEIGQLCSENSLNIELLKPFFELSMKGHNNTEIAQKIGVHRITVQRYAATLKKLKESEFQKLYQYVLGGFQDETRDKD